MDENGNDQPDTGEGLQGVTVTLQSEAGVVIALALTDVTDANGEYGFADVPAVVDKRTVADLADWPYPKNQLVPLVEVVHDRLNVEIFRGCTRGCRFCQAGMITRPVRERPEEQVRTMVRDGLRRTGYDEVALTSLSSADFSGIGCGGALMVRGARWSFSKSTESRRSPSSGTTWRASAAPSI